MLWLYIGLIGVVLGEGDWLRWDRKTTGFTLYSHVRARQASINIASVQYFVVFWCVCLSCKSCDRVIA